MKKEKNDILYSVNVELSKEKYKAMTKFISFSKSLFVIMLFRMSIILMYFVFLYFNDSQKRIYEPIIIFITLSIIVYIVSKKTRKYAEKEYNWLVKKGKIDVEYELIFYKNYLKKEGYISPVKVKYSDLINIVETDDMFYLFVEKDNSIIIDKKNCDEELIEFIRNSNEQVYKNKMGKKKYNLKQEKNFNREVVSKVLIILFIMNILAFIIAPYVWAAMCEKSVGILAITYTWVYYWFLPLPILSFILGVKFNKRRIKCKKNIVIGIIGFLIFISLGASADSFNTNSKRDYKEAIMYEEIIDAKLPSSGTFYKVVWDKSNFQEHNSNYLLFEDKEFEQFYKDINENANWVVRSEIPDNLKRYIPGILVCESSINDCHYSIYVKETDEYNSIPTVSGIYHMYAMMYDRNKQYIQIDGYVIEL